MCQRAVGKTWGLCPKLTAWLYKAIIRPGLDYGALFWITGTTIEFKRKLLERVQRLALLMITGAPRTTPTAGMEVILHIPPVDIFLKGQAMKGWRRLFRTNSICYNNSRANGHLGWIQSHIRSVPLTEIPPSLSDHCPRIYMGSKQYSCSISRRANWNNKVEFVRKHGITCFTGGSLNNYENTGRITTGCGVSHAQSK